MRGQGRVFRPKVRGQETAYWWLDYSVRGTRHRESSGTTSRTEAQRLLRQRLGARETGRLVGLPDRVLFPQLRELVVRQYGLDGRRSVWRIELAFKHLEGFFATDRAVDITPARVDAYVEWRRGQNAAPATINRELAALRRGFRLGLQKGVLAARPEFTIPQEHNARTGFLDADDAEALFAALPEPLGAVARFLYLTGWRKSEALLLTWAQVDFQAGVVRLDVGTTKSGEGRTFPFSVLPDLEALLRERWAQRDGLFVFHRGGQRIKDFYAAWHAAVRRAAVQRVDGREVVVRPSLVGRPARLSPDGGPQPRPRGRVGAHGHEAHGPQDPRGVRPLRHRERAGSHRRRGEARRAPLQRQTSGKHRACRRILSARNFKRSIDGGGSGLVA